LYPVLALVTTVAVIPPPVVSVDWPAGVVTLNEDADRLRVSDAGTVAVALIGLGGGGWLAHAGPAVSSNPEPTRPAAATETARTERVMENMSDPYFCGIVVCFRAARSPRGLRRLR
jgi:hypothetical protein